MESQPKCSGPCTGPNQAPQQSPKHLPFLVPSCPVSLAWRDGRPGSFSTRGLCARAKGRGAAEHHRRVAIHLALLLGHCAFTARRRLQRPSTGAFSLGGRGHKGERIGDGGGRFIGVFVLMTSCHRLMVLMLVCHPMIRDNSRQQTINSPGKL